MNFKDISEKSLSDLNKKKKELTQQIFLNKMKNTIGQLANPLQIRFIRKDIAKINTAISMRKHK